MLKKYVGKSRAGNLDWLANVWLRQGPPVCFLQGFAGVGKTDLARDFRELAETQGTWQQAVINEVADRPTPSVLESLMELSVVLSQQGLPEMEQVLFEPRNPNLGYAVEKALQRPVVIILDEAQRFFRADSGAPLPEMNGILGFLRNRPSLPGRLLLLSDRVVEEARWSEWIPKRTLTKLEPDEAVEALVTKLAEAGVTAEIPAERMKEVVRDLDFNPRAIEALVGALRYDSLDEIIESNPGLWAVRDREVSREFLKSLERDLLERTMRHLDEVHQRKLRRLAVHRRSFGREALEKLCGTRDEATELRSVLVTRFLLNVYKEMLALNPIVREISLARLRDDPAELRQAHSGAADYHLRHFKAKQMVGSPSKLGESFAELRYHLVQAGRESELSVIGQRFTEHLKREIHSNSRVPADPEELDERIGVLTVLLGSGGAKGLEYHLARCLQRRGRAGDLQQAIAHAECATGAGSPADAWVLLAKLYRQVSDTVGAMRAIDTACKFVAVDASLFSIYQLGAEILAHIGGSDEAVALLREGIQRIPPDQNLFSLYQCCADILAKSGRGDEAVALLREGIQRIPPDKGLSSLYQSLSEIHCRIGKPEEAITVLRQGLQRVPEHSGRYRLAEGALLLCLGASDSSQLLAIVEASGKDSLSPVDLAFGRLLQLQNTGDWAAAARMAKSVRERFPGNVAFAGQEAFSRLAEGDAEGGLDALLRPPGFETRKGIPACWLLAFIQMRRGARAEASAALSAYLGRPVDESRELCESFLLRLWDQQESGPESHQLCYRYPIMPASLTGLDRPVRRVGFAPPVLPVNLAPSPLPRTPRSPVTQEARPEIYVSYAWGEDATEAGRRREEIVDRLCAAVSASGRAIGRDKDRMRGGDSIERFAQEISRAARIVAVISEKSLHSDFCMAHELFRAYRRCDYQRAEFQQKVIALVMDDAKPYLKDHFAIVKLARWWGERLETLRAELHSVDPNRKSADLWVFVDLVEDMCPRLPAMLGALGDIVMKRGFDEIVRDGFREVIRLLPPAPEARGPRP